MLTGVLVRFEGGKLVMAATDSYRISVKETDLSGGERRRPGGDRPGARATELSRIAQDGGELRIGVQENHVVFGAGDVWLTTRRIDGQFPNYKQLLPETFEHEVTLDRGGVPRGRAPRLGDGAAQLAAPPPLCRGRADGLGADPGRRRGEGVAAGAVLGRAARDRVQPGVPA